MMSRRLYFATCCVSLLARTAVLSTLVAGAGGCRNIPLVGKLVGGQVAPEEMRPAVSVKVRIDHTTLRPGDPLVAHILIQNATSAALTVQKPDISSMDFYIANAGEMNARTVQPVFSPKEPVGEPQDVQPHEYLKPRSFVLPTLTREPVAYRLQEVYHPTPRGMTPGLIPAYASPVTFRVAGERSVRRDRDGVLLKEDAIAIAKRRLGRPAAEVHAFLVVNSHGVYDWWITMKIDPSDLKENEQAYQAFYVNPYTALVRAKAPPYIPKEKPKEVPKRTPPPPRTNP
jgi:hypothetical protein